METMRYFIDPFGCVKNQVDAENMMAHLNKAGCVSASAEEADIIIVNSCGFIESAKQESINAVLEWRKLYPGKKILLAGCLAQRYSKELSESLTEADGFFGVEDIAGVVDTVKQVLAKEPTRGHGDTGGTGEERGNRPLLSLPGVAYVKISEGCNNNCSFCAIPLIRGSLVCRDIADIVDECRVLLGRGVRELCIIGQDIGGYREWGVGNREWGDYSQKTSHGDLQRSFQHTEARRTRGEEEGLAGLLEAISLLEGKFWVRLLYIHPDHFPLGILDVMERDRRFLPYFDIPFQHASPGILTAMNRHGTAETYLELIGTIRKRLPGAVIRSTFLLGFPGETEEDFNALLDFQREAKLDWLGCFTYSREEGTAAFSMKGRVPAKTAEKRKNIIEERQIPITEKNMERFTGQNLEVLIEERIEGDSESFLLGRLYCQAPDIDGSAVIVCDETEGKNSPPGSLVPCKVTARRSFDLEVKLLLF